MAVILVSHIEKRPGEPAHLTRIPRIRIAQIAADYVFHGWSVDEMCHQHPYLTPAEAHAAMAYYFDHQEEIDQEIWADVRAYESALAQSPPSAFLLRMKAESQIA